MATPKKEPPKKTPKKRKTAKPKTKGGKHADPNKLDKNGKPKVGFALYPENINRRGRPPNKESLTHHLSKIGEIKIKDQTTGRMMSRNESLARIVWEAALVLREKWAIELCYNRIDGTPKQTVEHQGGLNIPELLTIETYSTNDDPTKPKNT